MLRLDFSMELKEANMNFALIAGSLSTMIFAFGTLPMLFKAYLTRDLSSYSLGYIGLNNIGNVIHSFYVFSLPVGPIWLLNAFYLVSTALMLVWYLRYEKHWSPLKKARRS